MLTAPVVRKVSNAIHWVNLYPVDSTVRFLHTYPLGSDLSVGYCYLPFEELDPGHLMRQKPK